MAEDWITAIQRLVSGGTTDPFGGEITRPRGTASDILTRAAMQTPLVGDLFAPPVRKPSSQEGATPVSGMADPITQIAFLLAPMLRSQMAALGERPPLSPTRGRLLSSQRGSTGVPDDDIDAARQWLRGRQAQEDPIARMRRLRDQGLTGGQSAKQTRQLDYRVDQPDVTELPWPPGGPTRLESGESINPESGEILRGHLLPRSAPSVRPSTGPLAESPGPPETWQALTNGLTDRLQALREQGIGTHPYASRLREIAEQFRATGDSQAELRALRSLHNEVEGYTAQLFREGQLGEAQLTGSVPLPENQSWPVATEDLIDRHTGEVLFRRGERVPPSYAEFYPDAVRQPAVSDPSWRPFGDNPEEIYATDLGALHTDIVNELQYLRERGIHVGPFERTYRQIGRQARANNPRFDEMEELMRLLEDLTGLANDTPF